MISLTISRKYARAFLQIGQKDGNFEALGRELDQLQELLQKNKELRSVLFSFAYPALTRKKIAGTLAQTLVLSKTTQDFLNLLIDRERMDHFSEIVKSYQTLCDEVTNRIRATLVTPADLPSDRAEEIKKQLESRTGKEVILSLERDSSLIGGALTRIGNVIYDGSLKTQLSKARENLYTE
ncbi:MAG: synthase delta subunit [Deltaproteobacteria bacterium]|nr:synthase delta subunit [Deltaproteobacteria bacterium]